MKHFIFKIALFISIPVLAMAIFLQFGRFLYHTPEYAMWKAKMDFVSKVHDTNSLIIGDSRAIAGFIPSIIGTEYYNLALGGSSPIEGYYLLKHYISKKNIKNLIISYAPSHLEFSDVFLDRTLPFGYFSTPELLEVLSKSKEFNENLFYSKAQYCKGESLNYIKKEQFYKDSLWAILLQCKFFYCYVPQLKKNFGSFWYYKNIETYHTIQKNRGYFDVSKLSSEKGLTIEAKKNGKFIQSHIEDYYVNALLSLAKEKNIKVYYITTPINFESISKIKKENPTYFASYSAYMKTLKLKYPNFIWHEEFSYYNDTCFDQDPSHLNRNGQIAFSNYVKRVLLDPNS